jgi:hypothetical protein
MRCTILALVALIACQDKKLEPPPSPPEPPHDGVTLVLPGAPPLQTLRYHLTQGSTTASELIWDFAADTDGQHSPMPTLIVDLETAVAEVGADGTAKLRITIARTRVRTRADSSVGVDLVRAEAAAMQGVIITETLAPDGKLSDSHVDTATLPDNVRTRLESLIRSLEQVAMRLPAEPVGIDATWRERRSLPEGGIRAVSETTYTLTSVTRDKIAYLGVGLATGAAQTIEQDGLKVEVTNTHGHSETRGTVDLARYAPEVTSTSLFATAMNIVAPKQSPGSGASTVEITMAIQVTPTDATGAETAPTPAPGVPTDAAPSGAAPSDAAPSDAAPSDAAPSDAAPSNVGLAPRDTGSPP